MRTVLTHATGLLAAALLTSSAAAADVKPATPPAGPDVHRMVVNNGPTTTVYYFSAGLSTSDEAALRDLERAENDAAYAENLQALRRRYVADEMMLEPHRSAIQWGLYGKSITSSYDTFLASPLNVADYFGYHYGYGYPYAYALSASLPGYASPYPYAPGIGSSSVLNQSLANGVGDEGALKTALAPVVASQATADYAAQAERALTTAMNRVGESDALRTALNLNPRGVAAAAAESARHVTVTLKGGDKVEGAITDEDSDWITVDTATDQVTVRKADVSRIDRHKK
jgi:hypothetical protein